MHLEIVAFGRRFLTVFQLDRLEVEEAEAEEPDTEELPGPAHYIPTPMKTYANDLGFRIVGDGLGFEREVN